MTAAAKWGLISGITSGAWMLMLYILELNGITANSSASFISWIFYFIGIFLSILHTREKEFGGLIEFKPAFKIGLKCASIAALIWGVLLFGYYRYLAKHPELIHKTNVALTEAEIENAISLLFQIKVIVITIGFTILAGTLFSLVLAMILKKTKIEE